LNGNKFEKAFYKQYSNKLTRLKKKTFKKKLDYHETISEQKRNPKELWKLIKSVIPLTKSSKTFVKLTVNNSSIEDPHKISQHFNNYFFEIGQSITKRVSTAIQQDEFKSYLTNSVSQTIYLDPPRLTEIYNTINSLNLRKASGHDNIS